ncbi:hypothetical protein N0M98_28040 [Paenibacillus doosanensis]|uniref:hypothetical protein n=1 Tax=Paenibacillus doosanensis TaxID=1229154 RepID=UPI002180211B|nr:hypothetical protein [Paenibacillus doosanensis]MCS7463965.1 hypothetical protein [Paenibacillus doosanensis]
MQRQWESLNESYRIRKAECQLRDGECTITWQWPKDVEYVYIYSFKEDEEQAPEQLAPAQLKLLTREEYKVKGGYKERVSYIGARGYRIFPCLRQGSGLTAFMQADRDNYVRVSGGRAQIRCSIKYGGRLFSKFKTARIQLFCEIAVPKEALCYVKKEGAVPAHKEDGIAYPFMSDFAVGHSALPEIEVGKHDFIRLFFTESRYGEQYELILES